MGSILNLLEGHVTWLSTPFILDIIKELFGKIGGALMLLIGLMLWAPAIAASREDYLLDLKTRESRYRILAEEATDMLAEHDGRGRFTFATQRSAQVVGYEPEELTGTSIYDYIDPEQLNYVRGEHAKILGQNGSRTVTYKFMHKDGRYIWLESTTRYFQQDEAAGHWRILSMSRDISERIKYEEDLKQLNANLKLQQQRLRILYELASSGDIETDEQLKGTLAAGTRTLGMDLGIISHIEGDKYTVLYHYPTDAGIKKNQVFELQDTYCSMTAAKNGVMAVDEMSKSEHSAHPCWDMFKLESYLGVPIVLGGEVFGTLAFSKRESRHQKFSEGDKDLVRLMGQWVSRVMDRERARVELQQSEKRYKSVISSSVVGVILIDSSGNIVSFNKAAESIFRYTTEEIKGSNVRILMHDSEYADSDDALKEYLETILPGFIGKSREVEALTKDGEVIYIDLGISVVEIDNELYYSGMVRDITARKKAEDALENAHLQLQSVFNSATQVGIIATDLEGKITIFNPGAESMLGYSPDEVLGKDTYMFHIDSEVEAWSKTLTQKYGVKVSGFETFVSLARLGGQEEHEWTYVRKDGSHLTVNSAVTALRDTSGQITGFLGIILDITARKEAEQSLILAKSIAEEANQTKSDFLANMSHELRTPLNSVIGFSGILLNSAAGKLGEKELVYLERIRENGKHLLQLINDILDLSKIESGRMTVELEETHLGEQVLEILKLIESQVASKPVELITKIPDELAPNLVDPGKIQQVLLNLLSNALKFTSQGSISIELDTFPESKRVSALRVSDTGIGIPPDRLEKIFDEFTQVDSSTHRKYGGTGLGLSISRRLCNVMACDLTVQSEVGKGSTFTINFPEHVDEEALKNAGNNEDFRRTRRQRNIGSTLQGLKGCRLLIIDDDEDSRTLLCHYLSDTGCIIDMAENREEALAILEKEIPDIITLDLAMPDISGEDLLKSIKANKRFQHIPVIVVSILAREYRGKIKGVVDYVPKPVQRQQLLWAIKRNINKDARRILIVEDDADMRHMLSNYAKDSGAELHAAADAQEAIEIIKTIRPDLILLDIMMPAMDGVQFLRHLLADERNENIQILVVTAKSLMAEEELFFKTEQIRVIKKGENLEADVRRHIQETFEG